MGVHFGCYFKPSRKGAQVSSAARTLSLCHSCCCRRRRLYFSGLLASPFSMSVRLNTAIKHVSLRPVNRPSLFCDVIAECPHLPNHLTPNLYPLCPMCYCGLGLSCCCDLPRTTPRNGGALWSLAGHSPLPPFLQVFL